MLSRKIWLPFLLSIAAPAFAEEAAKPVLPAISVVTVVSNHLTDRVFASGLIQPVERALRY